jgi:transketolase
MVNLTQRAYKLRLKILDMCVKSGGHIASAFSCVDLMVSLYYGGAFKFNSQNPAWEERDRFILSKGHGETALYAILADLGFFPAAWLETRYRQGDCFLGGHPDRAIPGVEVTTGALGHGLGVAAGISLAAKMEHKDHRQFVLLGDTECTEGSVWEAALFAAHHKLNNLIAIIDRNHLSALEFTEHFTALNPFAEKWQAWGWEAVKVNGHDLAQLAQTWTYARTREDERPLAIVAETIKGKGVSFMENEPSWHTRALAGEDEIQRARRELEKANGSSER